MQVPPRRFALSPARRSRALVALIATGALGGSLACSDVLGIEAGILVVDDAGPDARAPSLGGGRGDATVLPRDASSDAADTAPESDRDFGVDLGTQKRVTVVRGSSAQVTLSIVPVGGPRLDAVVVTVADLPGGVTADSLSIPATAASGALTLHATANATLTVTAALEITGTSGAFLHHVTIPLFIQDPPGTLDVTFGAAGLATAPLVGSGATGAIGNQGLAVQPDGQIVFCGNANFGTTELVLGRFTANGYLDQGFATAGLFAKYDKAHSQEVCHAIRLLPSEGIAVGGFALAANGPHTFLAAQFTKDGQPDPNFGSNGFVFAPIGDADSKAYDLALQQNGDSVDWILGGFSGGNFALVRLGPSGVMDTSFGPNGDGTVLGTLPDATIIRGVALAPDGGNVMASLQSTSSFLATWFTPDGHTDLSQGVNGQSSAPAATPQFSGVWGYAMQPDGKFVLSGETIPSGGIAGAAQLARFDNEGKLDTTFGQGGIVPMSIPGGSTTAGAIALTQDGGYAVCATLPTSTPIGVIRYETTGRVDTSFGTNGYTGISGTANDEAVAIDDAGRILLGAFVTDAAANTAMVVVARFWP